MGQGGRGGGELPRALAAPFGLRAHGAIAEAIANGEAERAVGVTRAHLVASQQYVASERKLTVKVLDEYGASRMPRRP